MKTYIVLLMLVLGLVSALSGCLTASTISPIRFFTIRPTFTVEAIPSSARSLGVRPLIGAKPYKLAIAYTNADNRLAYFQNAEWADLPATMLNRALMDGLVKLAAFSEVDDAANINLPNLILTGELRRFEADYNRETPAAVVEMLCTVRDNESDRSVWQGYVTAETPIPAVTASENLNSDASLATVAEAMSTSVSKVVAEACRKIGEAIKEQ